MSEFYDFKNMGVVYVDDNKEMQRLMRSLLVSININRIRCCPDAESCLEMIAEQPADMIITDLQLKSGSGIDLIRRIRASEANAERYVPILVLTGQVSIADVTAARDAGATEFLAKPVSLTTLHDRMVWMIKNPRPFIKAGDFIGPDRRRARRSFSGIDRRR